MLELVLSHSGAFLLFNGENYEGNNPFGIEGHGLIEVVSQYSLDLGAEPQANLDSLKKLLEKTDQKPLR